ncbi:hypothetical protein KIN20_034612 [Parelaphostrongylus tenuis]|uniref:Uncharacterized protein n=1 Tax=Parelaphostrongylus tenuis TaxID=148309 RepID=A0AAD5RA93_PARTN|nr:hypothetical protein KIN20_034612 [Parelaphostrongylus tenuis]
MFTKSEYRFYVPMTLSVGAKVGTMEVHDNDPVIYNSERSLRFTQEQSLLTVHADGSLILKEELSTQIPFKPIQMEVLAIDYGSPQLFSLANLTIVPVTVSQVQGLRVNVATENYQIFEWEPPSYGQPLKYRLTIARGEAMHYEEELDGAANVALTKIYKKFKWIEVLRVMENAVLVAFHFATMVHSTVSNNLSTHVVLIAMLSTALLVLDVKRRVRSILKRNSPVNRNTTDYLYHRMLSYILTTFRS